MISLKSSSCSCPCSQPNYWVGVEHVLVHKLSPDQICTYFTTCSVLNKPSLQPSIMLFQISKVHQITIIFRIVLFVYLTASNIKVPVCAYATAYYTKYLITFEKYIIHLSIPPKSSSRCLPPLVAIDDNPSTPSLAMVITRAVVVVHLTAAQSFTSHQVTKASTTALTTVIKSALLSSKQLEWGPRSFEKVVVFGILYSPHSSFPAHRATQGSQAMQTPQ